MPRTDHRRFDITNDGDRHICLLVKKKSTTRLNNVAMNFILFSLSRGIDLVTILSKILRGGGSQRTHRRQRSRSDVVVRLTSSSRKEARRWRSRIKQTFVPASFTSRSSPPGPNPQLLALILARNIHIVPYQS